MDKRTRWNLKAEIHNLIARTELPRDERLIFSSREFLSEALPPLVVERMAQAWDEGHHATDEHAEGECQCPNPYRAEVTS